MSWTAVSVLLRSQLRFFFRAFPITVLVVCTGSAVNAANAQRESLANTPSSLADITVLPTEIVRANAAPTPAAASRATGQVNVPRKTDKARSRPKIIAPIMQGFAELRNPVALFVAAKNHLVAATHFRRSDSGVAPLPSGVIEVTPLGVTPINVTFASVQSYQLTIPTSTAMGRLANAMEEELHPGVAPNRPSPLVRNSATQLNMRVNDAVSLLWEVERNDSPVDGSEVGMGIGFKLAF